MSSAIFPSAQGWITPRTTQARISSDNCMLILPQKIDQIAKVLVKADTVEVSYGMNDATTNYIGKLSDLYFEENDASQVQYLDITQYVVEQAKYNTLPIENITAEKLITQLCANNAHYYTHNEYTIYIQGESYKGTGSFWASTTAWNMSIEASFAQLLTDRKLYYKSNDGNFYEVYIRNPVVSNLKNNPMSAQFRVYYTPLGESVKLDAVKTNPQLNRFAIPYSQQQPIVDSVTHGREMQSIANRTGCEKKEIVRTCHDLGELRHPRDGWGYIEKDAQGNPTGNIWRLTAAHFSIYCETYIIVKETWSKNWSYRSENVPINREFRSWNIPADIVQRNLRWQDYCLITRKEIELPDNALLSNRAKMEFMRGFDGSSDGKLTECTNMWFYKRTGSLSIKGVVMNCSAFGFGNSLVFSGKTKDNLSAGVQRVKSDDKDGNHQFCKDVYYCDEDGRLDKMYIQIGAALASPFAESAAYLYPECGSTMDGDEHVTVNVPDSTNTLLFNEHEFEVLKDPSEQLNFTYQLHILTDDGFLVIGSTFASNNPLVKERNKPQTIKVWKLTKYIPQGAQVMTPIYGIEQDSSLFSVAVDSTNPSITFNPVGTTNDGVGVCVTDENNAVLIAFNNNVPATFKLHYTHAYKAIAEALN